ncbi:MAG: hypothetical protein LBD30_01030 [Verrucomicrobiales bacterium]|jgi:hypothetical protein|nr:hypothetical protein [Verrucomicrobiales bacterium]
MKTNTTSACQYPEPIEGFHTVEFFRKIKRKISLKTKDMTCDELRAYLDERVEAYEAKRAA